MRACVLSLSHRQAPVVESNLSLLREIASRDPSMVLPTEEVLNNKSHLSQTSRLLPRNTVILNQTPPVLVSHLDLPRGPLPWSRPRLHMKCQQIQEQLECCQGLNMEVVSLMITFARIPWLWGTSGQDSTQPLSTAPLCCASILPASLLSRRDSELKLHHFLNGICP